MKQRFTQTKFAELFFIFKNNETASLCQIICAINNKKIIHFKIIKGSANANIFKNFLEELIQKGIHNKYLLLDNARIHHAKLVKDYIKNTS